MSHTHRAIADGFYDGVLVSKDATFTPYEGFEAPWAVEVAERANTASNAGEQETISEAITPVYPELSDAAAPLPAFHPAVAVPTKVEDAKASAAVGDPVKQPVVASAESRSTSDPKKAKPAVKRKEPDVPSEAEVEAAKDASKAEVEQADAVDDGVDLT